jgi:hypothetical protein
MVRRFLLFTDVLLSLFLALFWLTHLHVCLNSSSWLLPCVVLFQHRWSWLLAHSASNLTGHLWSAFNCLRLICLLVDGLVYWVNRALLFICWILILVLIALDHFGVFECIDFLLRLGLDVWVVTPWLLVVGGVYRTKTWAWVRLITDVVLQRSFNFIFS